MGDGSFLKGATIYLKAPTVGKRKHSSPLAERRLPGTRLVEQIDAYAEGGSGVDLGT